MIGCEQLFQVIPVDNIPTYKEFMELDCNSKEFAEMVRVYKHNTYLWFEKFFSALSFYVSLEDEMVRASTILDMLYVVGDGGKIKYHQNNKLAMLYRMIIRELDIPMN